MSRTRLLTALPAGVWLLAGACGPGAATPMPQPPTVFDLARVGQPETQPAYAGDNVEIVGGPGAVPARATVRIVNLDQPAQAAAADAGDNGAFSLPVFVTNGQELRFEWVKGTARSAPADAFFIRPDPAQPAFELEPSARFDCLTLSPPHTLELTEAGSATLTISNECDDAVTLVNPRARIGLSAFTLPTELPTLEPGASTELIVDFDGGDPAANDEDTLLFDVTLGAETIRYPVTLRGTP